MLKRSETRPVAILLYDGVTLLDFAGPAEVLGAANAVAGRLVYDVHFVTVGPAREIATTAGLRVHADAASTCPTALDLLLVPGAPEEFAIDRPRADAELLAWLSGVAASSARVASVCSGAFLLAAAGLLDGRRATTHWYAAERLAADHPRVRVQADALYVRDGNVWTSAGVTAGVDMLLALVAEDLGAHVALQVARQLVLYLVRNGGQSQFSGPMDLQTRAARAGLVELVAWIEAHVHEPIDVDRLAERACTTARTLTRRCRSTFGLSPARLVAEIRLERARTLLGDASVGVKAVARQCGFADHAAFSKAFLVRFGTTPTAYRDAFALHDPHTTRA